MATTRITKTLVVAEGLNLAKTKHTGGVVSELFNNARGFLNACGSVE